jgi:hypothetical protein
LCVWIVSNHLKIVAHPVSIGVGVRVHGGCARGKRTLR